MYEYHKEQISESGFAPRSQELAAEGWRLVTVAINPLSTEEACPLYVTFWEKQSA